MTMKSQRSFVPEKYPVAGSDFPTILLDGNWCSEYSFLPAWMEHSDSSRGDR